MNLAKYYQGEKENRIKLFEQIGSLSFIKIYLNKIIESLK